MRGNLKSSISGCCSGLERKKSSARIKVARKRHRVVKRLIDRRCENFQKCCSDQNIIIFPKSVFDWKRKIFDRGNIKRKIPTPSKMNSLVSYEWFYIFEHTTSSFAARTTAIKNEPSNFILISYLAVLFFTIYIFLRLSKRIWFQ